MGCCAGKEGDKDGSAKAQGATSEPFDAPPVGVGPQAPPSSAPLPQPSRAHLGATQHNPLPALDRGRPSGNPSTGKQARPRPNFTMGEKVSAKWVRDGQAYPGWIIGVRSDGTYKVQFEDGETDVVNYMNMKRRFAAGDRVDARWKGGHYYRGWISDVGPNGDFYSIAFDDGGVEDYEPLDHIRTAADPSPVSKGALPAPGARQFVPPTRGPGGGHRRD